MASEVSHVSAILWKLDRIASAYQVKATYLFLGSRQNLLLIQACESVIKETDLHLIITGCICRHRRTGIDLDQPGFEVGIEQDIESIQLEAMLIVYNSLLYRLKTANDHFLDLCE